jgi:murein L,D-transpeptidase YafK
MARNFSWVMLFMTLLMTSADTLAQSRVLQAAKNTLTELKTHADKLGVSVGSRVFIRILKTEKLLELYLQNKAGKMVLFRSYPICTFSGALGPKLIEGDGQAPEGFYWVEPIQMNPSSRFHLSFNLGYPNAYDRAHGRTGSALMVHGSCVSVGCYAMTDAKIEEIYTLMDQAYKAGQDRVKVLALPFAMTAENLKAAESEADFAPWLDLWQQLATIDAYFLRTQVEPKVLVSKKRYQLKLD